MAEINNDEKRITVSGEQIEEAVGKVPTIEADVKANKQNISALQADVSKHTEDIAKNTADIEKKANADEVYSKDETDNAITAKVAEIVAGAPEEFDTLKEMSDWLTEHSDSAATMNTAIQANTKAIDDNATAIEGNTADIEQNKSDILTVKNDIAINRATSGTQCKNLFNKDGNINQRFNGSPPPDNSFKNLVSDNLVSFRTPLTQSQLAGQFIKNVKGKKITISGNFLGVESTNTGDRCIFRVYPKNKETHLSGSEKTFYNKDIGEFSFTVDCGEYDEVLVSAGVYYNVGGIAKIENLMVRYADITDGSYEPYVPSLQEQINALVERIQALETAQTQNE